MQQASTTDVCTQKKTGSRKGLFLPRKSLFQMRFFYDLTQLKTEKKGFKSRWKKLTLSTTLVSF